MSITKEQILDAVADMSVIDVTELISMMEKKFNVSINNITESNIHPANNKTNTVEEKIEFDVVLTAVGNNKVSVIKTVRSVTSLGLKEAKDLVESAPVIIKENMNKEDAASLEKTLKEAGASVEIK